MTTSKFCADCGKALKSSNAIVCTECGAGVQSDIVGKKWSQGMVIFLYVMAVFMPLIGGIGGLVGLFNPQNRQNGMGLIVLSFLCWFFWTVVFMGMIGLGI